MINGRSVLMVIPARGGSKGLPGKNLRPVDGRPLLAWTIESATASKYADRVIVSSDDDAIMQAAKRLDCDVPFRRPAALATDTATTLDVILHALDSLPPFDLVVVLQPTSPLRTREDIDAACALLVASGAPTCVSVSPVEQTPYWMYWINERNALVPVVEAPVGVTRRQDLPAVFALNGAVYVADVRWLREHRTFVSPETVGSVMPLDRSLDIDSLEDFEAFRRVAEGVTDGAPRPAHVASSPSYNR